MATREIDTYAHLKATGSTRSWQYLMAEHAAPALRNIGCKTFDILVLGAGVLGTLYAARLSQAGHRVSLWARGERLEELRREGAQLEDLRSGARTTVRIQVVDGGSAAGAYDLILVVVRKTQLDSALACLQDCSSPSVLFLLNNPEGPARLEAIGRERLLLGFPGAGGTLDRGVVRYALIPQQSTTIGEPSGAVTPRLRATAGVLRSAGFPTSITRSMTAWLKTHALFVTAISGALYAAGASAEGLARDETLLRAFVLGVRQGFEALRAAGVAITPWKLSLLFRIIPPASPSPTGVAISALPWVISSSRIMPAPRATKWPNSSANAGPSLSASAFMRQRSRRFGTLWKSSIGAGVAYSLSAQIGVAPPRWSGSPCWSTSLAGRAREEQNRRERRPRFSRKELSLDDRRRCAAPARPLISEPDRRNQA